MRRQTFLVVLGLFVGSTQTSAQQPVKPDSVQAQMEQASVMMAPMMGQMTQFMVEGTLKAMAKPENVELLATFTRNYYDALRRKGFTKEEALQIVVATGIPRMPSGGR